MSSRSDVLVVASFDSIQTRSFREIVDFSFLIFSESFDFEVLRNRIFENLHFV